MTIHKRSLSDACERDVAGDEICGKGLNAARSSTACKQQVVISTCFREPFSCFTQLI